MKYCLLGHLHVFYGRNVQLYLNLKVCLLYPHLGFCVCLAKYEIQIDLFIGQRQSSERTHCAMCSAWGNYSVHCYGRPLEKGIQCVEHLAVR